MTEVGVCFGYVNKLENFMSKKHNKFDTSQETPENISYLAKKKFTTHDLVTIHPKNPRQQQFFDEVQKDTPMISLEGHAGTGKSFCALYAALHEVFDPDTEYQHVVIIRSAVESRKIGYLPGSEEEKAAAYEKPYKQVIGELIRFKTAYDNLKALGYLSFELTSHLRGVTYNNTIIILDESQNLDASELRTVITRLGTNSKIFLCGDSKQNDLERYREKSGLKYLNDVMKMMPYGSTATINFKLDDIVRSGLVREFLIADSKVSEG